MGAVEGTATARRGRIETAVRRAIVGLGAPLVRAYMQSPVHWGKRPFWRTIGERFFWQSRAFETTTEFGAIICGHTGDFIPSAVYYFGVWEPHLTRFIQARLGAGDGFVDVGANIGYYTLLASMLVGKTGQVVALEASARIHRTLVHHIDVNHATNVRVVHCAVSDAPGELTVFAGPEHNAGRTTTIVKSDQPVVEGTVRADTLAALLTPREAANARIVKIDVEGAEWSVVQGMRPLLANSRADLEIVVEVAPERLVEQGRSVAELFDVFGAHGFHPYALENDYEMISYVPPVAPRPIVRVRPEQVTAQTDIVFSRVDRATL